MRRASAPLLLSVFLATGPVFAQLESVAESLFREARAEMKAGNYDRACPKLAESQRLDPSPGTLLNLAICEEQVGRVATAWVRFRQLLDTIPSDDPRARIANEHLDALGPNLPQLRLAITEEPGVEFVVRLDGVELDATTLSDFFPVDPGDHRIEVSAGPDRTSSELVNLGPGARIERQLTIPPAPRAAEVPPVAPVVAAPPPSPSPAPPPVDRVPPARPRGRLNGFEVAGIVGGGVGLVTLGVAGVFTLEAMSLQGQSNSDGHCEGNRCDDTGLKLRHQAGNKADAATLLAVAGGAVVAGGVVLYFIGRGQRDSVALGLGASELRMRLRF